MSEIVPSTRGQQRQQALQPLQPLQQLQQAIQPMQPATNRGNILGQPMPEMGPTIVRNQPPLSQQTLDQQPLNQQPLSQQPLSHQPLNQQPLSQQPLSYQPLSQQPLSHQPLSQQPLSQQPLSHQPLSQQPFSNQPLSHQPLTTMAAHLGEVPAHKSHPTTTLPGMHKAQPLGALMPSNRSNQLMRGDRHLFSTSDDNAMMRQIMTTHAPDGRDFDVKPLFVIVEDIMHRSTPSFHGPRKEIIEGQTHIDALTPIDALEERALHGGYSDLLELLAYPINKTSCEIICKCNAGGDAHLITMALFQTLSSYSWEAKVTIAFAAFAVNYGEFWLVAQLYTTNPLAKSVALLKELPEIMEHTDILKQKFEAINNLIKAMLDVTQCIIKFKDLPTMYITSESPEMLAAATHIPTAAYWTIRSIVACSTIMLNLIALGHEYVASAAESWELNSLAHKLENIRAHLEGQMGQIYQKIEERRQNDAYLALIRLFETPHIDNMKILRALIYAKEDQLPLYDGTHKRRSSLDVLRRKHVLLLISDLDMSHEELSILHQMYSEAKQQPTRPESQYEVVWLPVVDRMSPWTDDKQKQFELVQNTMPWYSVASPMMLDPAVIRFIKEFWGFTKKPQLVVLDPQGKESNRNALHMMWIWGSLAFPFTKAKEEALWREETWRMELLADSIDPNLFQWVNENKYICLYGGEDIEWIRKFTTSARAVANAAGISLEMLYVGKSNPKERVRRNNSIIQVENLSHVLPDLTLIWFFWVRLESMWHSKVQHGMTVENDPIMQEIVTMLSFDGSDQGWAVFARGAHEMARGKSEIMLECLSKYDTWKDRVVYPDGFVITLDEQLKELHTPHHCNRLILPGTTGQIPEKVVCAECSRPMERFIMYRCCND